MTTAVGHARCAAGRSFGKARRGRRRGCGYLCDQSGNGATRSASRAFASGALTHWVIAIVGNVFDHPTASQKRSAASFQRAKRKMKPRSDNADLPFRKIRQTWCFHAHSINSPQPVTKEICVLGPNEPDYERTYAVMTGTLNGLKPGTLRRFRLCLLGPTRVGRISRPKGERSGSSRKLPWLRRRRL